MFFNRLKNYAGKLTHFPYGGVCQCIRTVQKLLNMSLLSVCRYMLDRCSKLFAGASVVFSQLCHVEKDGESLRRAVQD